MESDRFQRLSDLFERATALTPDQRSAFLDEQCNGDAPLRAELEALLGHSEKPDDPVVTAAGLDALFEEAGIKPRGGGPDGQGIKIPDVVGGNSHHTPNTPSAGAAPGGATSAMPLLTGQYRILRVIGEGGMGIVYEAEQAFPKRRVALKSIRPGMFSRRMLRRFQNEAHILGRLQHPGIAQIYEAGASDPQSPDDAFFVMEFVNGPPLNIYAEQRKLRTRDKLELMIKVCEAVHHAHQRGVIHRDLKPGNILVAEAEHGAAAGEAQPKVLDFGVARVTDARPIAETMQTHAGQLIGTLAYMSPEQISVGPKDDKAPDGGDIDVRTDVYALGVILYQLLTGKLPIELADKSIPDAAQMVRESEPSKLGTIDRAYRGDLETIVAKALEKDRARRYQSAADLGDDVRRYLNGEAIAAKRDSAMYVLRKQVKRHKVPVAAGAIIFVGLIAFAIVASIQATHNRTLANQLEDQLTVANADRGRLESLSGTPALGERTMWTERLQRPDLQETYWALWEFYARQPILRSTAGAGMMSGRLVLTPDGKILVRTGRDGEIQGWTPDLARCLWRIEPDGASFNAGVAAPDGSFVALAGAARIVFLNPADGTVIGRINSPGTSFLAMVVEPNAERVITGDMKGNVIEWDASAGTRVRRVHSYSSPVSSLALSPDGKILIESTNSGVCSVVDVKAGRAKGTIPIKASAPVRTQFSPDGSRLYAASPTTGVVTVFDTATWEPTLTFNTGEAHTTALIALDNNTLLTAGPTGIRTWDALSGSPRDVFAGDEGTISAITAGPQPGYFYTYGPSVCVRLWEDTRFRCVRRFLHSGRDWMFSVVPSPDGKFLAGADSAGVLSVWRIDSGELLGQCDGPGGMARAITWWPGSSTRFIAGFGRGDIATFDATDTGPKLVDHWHAHDPTPNAPPAQRDAESTATAFSPNGAILATGSIRGQIKLWNAADHSLRLDIKTTQTQISALDFSPDGTRLAVSGASPGVAIYSVASGEMIASVPDIFRNWCVKFSPDDSILAAAISRSEIQLYDPRTLAPLRVLRAHGKPVVYLTFSDDGQSLASGSADGTLRLWNVRTGRPLVSLESGAEVSWVSFIPGSSGRSIVTCGPLGQVKVWDLSYYDRHIAGNTAYLLNRLGPILPKPPRTDELLKWALAATGDPSLSFEDPVVKVPLRSCKPPASQPSDGR